MLINADKNIAAEAGKRDIFRPFIRYLASLSAAAAAAICVNLLLVINATVASSSMEPTIMTGDRVFGLRVLNSFTRHDIVIFDNPVDEGGDPYVKRIVGLPGETLEIRGNRIYINGSPEPLDESAYLRVVMTTADEIYEVPENAYFCLGDNRGRSVDSRSWGFVYRENIIGEVYIY